MMPFGDLYRLTRQEQQDRIEAARRERLVRSAHPEGRSLRERLRLLYGTLMTLLA